MTNIEKIYSQINEYIKMRKDIKSKKNVYEINEIIKIKRYFLIDKEWLKKWKKLIDYYLLKYMVEEEKIKAYIRENIIKKEKELDELGEIRYLIDYEQIVKENKRYKIVTKELLNCFLNSEQKISEVDNCLS